MPQAPGALFQDSDEWEAIRTWDSSMGQRQRNQGVHYIQLGVSTQYLALTHVC